MKKSLFTFLALALGASLFGTNFCVGPAATGTGAGTDWNNKAAWASVSFARGSGTNVYYLEDGPYAPKTLSTATSGTNLITIRKATVTDHGTETGWIASMGDGQAVITAPLIYTSSYWVLDGLSRTGIRSGYGIKVTNGVNKSNVDVTQYGVNNTSAVSNITVQYVEIEGSGTDGDAINDSTISCHSTSGFVGCSDITWRYCWVHDSGLVLLFWRQGLRLTAEYCVIERNDSTTNNHSEGFVLRGRPVANGQPAGSGSYLIRYNILSDIEGTAFMATPSGPTHHFTNLWVYGNVIMTPTPNTRGGAGSGILAIFDCDIFGECKFYNNTMINIRDSLFASFAPNNNGNSTIDIGLSAGAGVDMDEIDVQNNLWVDCDRMDYPWEGTSAGGARVVSHAWLRNAYFGTTNTIDIDPNKQVLGTDPLPNWQGGVFTLGAATNTGSSLASPFNADGNGLVRGADGVWDRGAYEYASGGGGGGDTTAPTIAITAPTSGTTYTTATSPMTTLVGTAGDNVAVGTVTWSNSAGGSGSATGTTSWSVASIALTSGSNVITVTATDSSLNTATDVLTVTYNPPDGTPPVVSSRNATSTASTTAYVTWTTDESATGKVQYGLTTGYGTESTLSGFLTNHSHRLTGLTSGTLYHYRIVTADAAANTTTTTDGTFTTLALPTAPGSPAASNVGKDRIDVSWSNVSGETGYALERSLVSGSGFTVLATPGVNVTSYADTALNAATAYFYRVRSYVTRDSTTDYSAYSAEATDTTDAPSTPGVTPKRPHWWARWGRWWR